MAEPRSLWARLRGSIREVGPVAALVIAVDRLLRLASRGHARLVVYALTAQPIGNSTERPLRPSVGTVVKAVAPSDGLVDVFPRPMAVLQQRYASGAECLAATVKGEFAGMLWIARRHYDEDEVRCLYSLSAPTRCVWDFDVYVTPAYRGTRVLARLWQTADQQLSTEGIRWSFSRIALNNAASLAVHQRLGARRVGTACFWVLGPLQISIFSQAPFAHVGLTGRQRPTLRLVEPLATQTRKDA